MIPVCYAVDVSTLPIIQAINTRLVCRLVTAVVVIVETKKPGRFRSSALSTQTLVMQKVKSELETSYRRNGWIA
jgi:hypothetical protein